jgi:small subunit ribosomal protein S9
VRMRRLVRTAAQWQKSIGGLISYNYQAARCINLSSSLLNSTGTTAAVTQSSAFVVDGSASGYSDENDENYESEYEDLDSDELEDWEDPLHPTQYRERKIDKYGQAHGVGRRKTAVARVWIKPGVGQVKVNHQDVAEYFQNGARSHALEAFQVTETAGLFDVWCLVRGGGFMGKTFHLHQSRLHHFPLIGQAGAVRLGLARALEAFEPGLKPFLKRGSPPSPPLCNIILPSVEKLLTRDSRMVERKKPGLKKARKRKTWVKR